VRGCRWRDRRVANDNDND